MSGSIGGSRIKREEVELVAEKYSELVLKPAGISHFAITGSYNAGTKKDHGDIDLVVLMDGSKKEAKKRLKEFMEESPYVVEFASGKRAGQKAQLFGDLVTCGFPIDNERYVQIDNVVTTSPESFEFQRHFLNMDAAKQALVSGLVRVIEQYLDKNTYMKDLGVPKAELKEDQELEFVISTSGLSYRLVTLEGEHEKCHEELWRSCDWSNVLYLLRDFNLNTSYDKLLEEVKLITKPRDRRRIVGVMKSIIHIGSGEEGTEKGYAKSDCIRKAEEALTF